MVNEGLVDELLTFEIEITVFMHYCYADSFRSQILRNSKTLTVLRILKIDIFINNIINKKFLSQLVETFLEIINVHPIVLVSFKLQYLYNDCHSWSPEFFFHWAILTAQSPTFSPISPHSITLYNQIMGPDSFAWSATISTHACAIKLSLRIPRIRIGG